uniref:TIP41-like protein n=1 Tax=Caenorhabditis tropicalis TaxID=1561998 RepID=A0A1I7TWW0_9PELO
MEATKWKREKVDEVMARAAEHAGRQEQFQQDRMKFFSQKGHILESSCRHSDDVSVPDCLKCKYKSELELEELPEMVFARNRLKISFGNDKFIELNALDALKMVISDRLPDVKVGASTVWQSTRMDRIQQINEHQKPFDWTFTTHYKGTIEGLKVEPTTERIDMDRLRRHDHQIAFTTIVPLFEDELADHGTAELVAKIRVMKEGYFLCVLRFYMRVDKVLIRMCDTRIVGNTTDSYFIREWTLREAKMEDLMGVELPNLLNPDLAWQFLPVIREEIDKISTEN